jgi:hypothetical protein
MYSPFVPGSDPKRFGKRKYNLFFRHSFILRPHYHPPARGAKEEEEKRRQGREMS